MRVLLLFRFVPFTFVESERWIGSLGVKYVVGVDGISVFMVALNWSNLVQVGLLLLVYSPAAAMLLPPPMLRFVGTAAVAYILIYEWFIAKIGLDISGGKAVAIVLLDSLIGLAIFALASIGQH